MRSFRAFARTVPFAASTAALLFAGCASSRPTQSGFLRDYRDLRPVGGAHELASISRSLAAYRFLAIAPVELRFDPKKAGISREEGESLCATARGELSRALAGRFLIVSDGEGPGALVLRAAITRVETSDAVLNAITTAAVFVPLNNGGVCLEWRLVDGTKGVQVAEGIDVATGKPWQVIAAFRKVGQARLGLHGIADDVARLISGPAMPKPEARIPD